MTENERPTLACNMRKLCQIELCPELLRASEEADKLRALLAKALDHIPEGTPLASESRAALD
jgi:hypothetical protein